MTQLTAELLQNVTNPGHAAIRLRQRLQPAAGVGAKLFPPTFSGGVYCWERRITDEGEKLCVLLDSVASQSNRLEEALSNALDDDLISIPTLEVALQDAYPEIGNISTLRAPHRVFDAILRDSSLNGTPFFKTPIYQELARASQRDASVLLTHSPTSLVFGSWDSTGAAGGLGNKFARAIASEIIGIGAIAGGNEGGVRVDPLGASSKVEISKPKDDAKVGDWEPKKTVLDGEKLKSEQKPSSINHGNILVSGAKGKGIAPSSQILSQEQRVSNIPLGGGVTVEYAEQISVLSLGQLRRLRFGDAQRNIAARAYLAALGVLSLSLARDEGYTLRSRCDLVADNYQPFELVMSNGERQDIELDTQTAITTYEECQDHARSAGFEFLAGPMILEPQDKLLELIRLSRLAERGVDE